MLSADCLAELRAAWLPNVSDVGLERLLDLLEKGSPLLVSGCFTRAIPMGCMASHAAWNHPATQHLNVDAGIAWLHGVAGLNPATRRLRPGSAHRPDRRAARRAGSPPRTPRASEEAAGARVLMAPPQTETLAVRGDRSDSCPARL